MVLREDTGYVCPGPWGRAMRRKIEKAVLYCLQDIIQVTLANINQCNADRSIMYVDLGFHHRPSVDAQFVLSEPLCRSLQSAINAFDPNRSFQSIHELDDVSCLDYFPIYSHENKRHLRQYLRMRPGQDKIFGRKLVSAGIWPLEHDGGYRSFEAQLDLMAKMRAEFEQLSTVSSQSALLSLIARY